MHTFAEKPRANPQALSASSEMLARDHFRQSHQANWMPQRQHAAGSQAARRLSGTNPQAGEEQSSSASRITRLDRDFSSVRPFSGDQPRSAWRGAGNAPAPPISSPLSEADVAPAGPPGDIAETTPPATPPPAAAGSLRWRFIPQHRWDALWYFCGEHPSGFSITATLRAEGFTNPNNVEWFVRQGADKVYAPGGFSGPEIVLHSSEGSRRPDDVQIEVQERLPGGGGSSYQGGLTVRKPYRLRQEWSSDSTTCPDPSLVPHPAIYSEINYRIIDNVGGTIIGATVNERFPSPPVNDQPNNWSTSPTTSTQNWPNTNGTFTDNLYQCGGTPAPVTTSSSQWGDKVYHMRQEFYVGSTTPGRGCRVQWHTLQFYRGYADQEGIHSPAP